MAQWFAAFAGAAHASLAGAVFSFNGLAIAQVRYPHFEILLATFLILSVHHA